MVKIVWGLLFLISLLLYVLFLGGAGSGAATGSAINHRWMVGIVLAVLIGVACGIVVTLRFFAARELQPIHSVAALVAIWPLIYLVVMLVMKSLK
jgi:hypothetical protein